jgi:hypothetical protein
MRAGMARVFAIYDAGLAQIQADIRERLADHPEFGPLIRDLPGRPGAGGRQPRRLRAAMIDWRWDGYWDNTASRRRLRDRGDPARLVGRARQPVPPRPARARDRGSRARGPARGHPGARPLARRRDRRFAQAFVSANEGVIEGQQRAIRQLSTPVLQLRPGL